MRLRFRPGFGGIGRSASESASCSSFSLPALYLRQDYDLVRCIRRHSACLSDHVQNRLARAGQYHESRIPHRPDHGNLPAMVLLHEHVHLGIVHVLAERAP